MDESRTRTAHTERLRSAFERSAKAIELRPSVGKHTAVSRVTVQEGVVCEIQEGRWTLVADLSEKAGGTGQGPDPGVLGRAALGSCLAMAYVLWAAKLDVPLERLEVVVEADFDAGAQYGVTDGPAGYTEVRYTVTVESSAPEEEVSALLDQAEKHCPYLDVFGRAQKMVRTVEISRPRG